MKARSGWVLFALMMLLLPACGIGGDDDDFAGAGGSQDDGLTIVTVDQLGEVVEALTGAFERAHPESNLNVRLFKPRALASLAGDAQRPGEVFVVADNWLKGMRDRAGPATLTARPFGRHLWVIAVPKGNPAGVTELSAFDQAAGLRTRVCGPRNRFGNWAALLIARAGVSADPSTIGVDCDEEAVAQVAQGERDAALVRRNALADTAGVDTVEIPDDANIIIGLSTVTVNPGPASIELAEYLETGEAQLIRTLHGYLP